MKKSIFWQIAIFLLLVLKMLLFALIIVHCGLCHP